MNENNFSNVPKPKYVTEYRKLGELFRGKRPGEKSYLDKLVLQTFISLVIIALVLFINNINTDFTKSLSAGIKTTISWNVDFSKTIDTFSNLKNLIPEAKKSLMPEGNGNNSTETTGGGLGLFTSGNRETLFIMPVDGTISSEFGEKLNPVFNTTRMHNGIDINAEIGTPIVSATSGTVTKVGTDGTNGNYVNVKTDNYDIIYGHCLKIAVKEGQQVKQGEKIAEVGDTGIVSVPGLYFEVREDGKPIDPAGLINKGETN